MKIVRTVKKKLRAGVPSFGTWIMSGSLASAEILAAAGFDWITIDMEHTSIDYRTLEYLIVGIRTHGGEVFVRIEENSPSVIKRVLDCGADGIIVPLVNSRHEVQEAVRAAKYPPEGIRGVSLGRASGYGLNFKDYFGSINDQIVVIAQIEHYQAVDKIDEILSVDGLDGVFLGPYDLSGSMGIVAQFEHPRMVDARRAVVTAGRKAGKAVGIHEVRPDASAIQSLVGEGFTFIACSMDTVFLGEASRNLIAGLR